MKIQCNYLLLGVLLFLSSHFAWADKQYDDNTQPMTKNSEGAEVSPAEILHLVDQRNLDKTTFDRAVQQSDSQLAIMAIQGMGRIGGDKAVTLISKSLNNSQEAIRVAATFSLGISGSAMATPYLWERLAIEKSANVRREIYLALGNIAPANIIPELLAQYKKEQQPEVIASVFQGLIFAVTFHPEIANNIDMKKSQTVIDFAEILTLLERDDIVSYYAGYFLARIKNLEKRISPAQLQKFTHKLKQNNNKKIFAKLIGKIAKRNHLANRRLLSWLIEQSESLDLGLATESIRAMGKLLYIPQAKIQLGKLQASKTSLIAQTALKALAESNLQGREIKALLKKQLKNDNPGIVVEAIGGLLNRQERDDMSWALKILTHQSSYVKIRFAQMVFSKDPVGFKNVIAMLAKNQDPFVAKYASELLNSSKESAVKNSPVVTSKIRFPLDLNRRVIELNTTQGAVTIRLNNEALYTGLNFIRLVKSGFYNNTYFSRVIGNFVAQGGDTIGDGEGSNKETIREELSYLSHSRGTVGMATSGKDTGDSQFYINLADNIHLDRHYTIFGQVERGMEVVSQLSNGDRIISAKVIQ